MEPIDPGGEGELVQFAKDQAQYNILPARRVNGVDGAVRTRWCLSAEERRAIACGSDIALSVLTFGNPLQPVNLEVTDPFAGSVCPLCGAEMRNAVSEFGSAFNYIARGYSCGTKVTTRGAAAPDEVGQSLPCYQRAQAATE